MKQQYYRVFVVLFIAILCQEAVAERTYNVLFIQSYTSQTPWHKELNRGLLRGLEDGGVNVNITTEYLDADYWTFQSEKVIMRRFCERARDRETHLIVTSGDEAFYTLFACGDSLPLQVPVVFFGIKYLDKDLVAAHPNACGFIANPDFNVILQEAHRIFPQRKEVICLTDSSFLSSKGLHDFQGEWKSFEKANPDYSLKVFNTQGREARHAISYICYRRNNHDCLVIAPKWSPFLSFVGKNSKAPVFATQNASLTNGVFGAYDADAYTSSIQAGERAASVLRGAAPKDIGVSEMNQEFMYDYKQLKFFGVKKDKVSSTGTVMNESFFRRYRLLFLILYFSVLASLVVCVVRLMRVNRREAKHRIQAQTRLLVQNRLVEQRNEFDNIFHSICDGVVTYGVDLHIHFVNRSLLEMLHLPFESGGRIYEGMIAGSIFKIYHNGQDILHEMLNEVAKTGQNVVIPQGAFMKEVHSNKYFPVSGEIVPILSRGTITGMALSARNISNEEMQKRYFDMAVDESSIYPWQYDVEMDCFVFPQGFLTRFGYDESVTTITRDEIDRNIHPYDVKDTHIRFSKVLAGELVSTRLSFRQRNEKGEYEWWEYRISVVAGLTQDSLYNILGVCQSIQRYKTAEQEMREARDKALQADKLKSAFLANISHEIRTPLNAIVGFSDLLRDTSSFTEDEVSQFVATINKNCGLLLALINDILDLSRIESGTMEFVFAEHNLSFLLKIVYDSQRLNMPEGVELVLSMPEQEKKYIKTDNIRLQQVINNLINNAAKFTNSGCITFGYEEDEEPGYTRLFVEDTGVGISEEGIRHIFERFYKVDSFTQGVGLGLSICQTIVQRMKGTISVTSEVGKGTRFIVRIPDSCE